MIIPVELLNYTINFIEEDETRTLLALTLANRVTRSAAERILFRTFRVSTSCSSVQRYVASYLRRLTQHPHLAAYTLRLQLVDYGSVFMKTDETEELFTKITIILRLSTNLWEMSIETLQGHSRLFQLLKEMDVPLRSLLYETQHPQPQMDFEAALRALASNHALQPTRFEMRSPRDMDPRFSFASLLPTFRAPEMGLRRLMRFVTQLEGDDYVMNRLLPLCNMNHIGVASYPPTFKGLLGEQLDTISERAKSLPVVISNKPELCTSAASHPENSGRYQSNLSPCKCGV